jgi:TonB-linked SusC/RagA family outer membrane protein
MKKNALTKLLFMITVFTYHFIRLGLIPLILATNLAVADGQTLNKVKVSFQSSKHSLIEIFGQIEKTTEYSFTYSNEKIPLQQTIYLDTQNQTLGNILEQIASQASLEFKSMDKQIFVKNIVKTIVSGEVIDEATAEPLIGASIQVKGTTIGTTTEANGTYSIEVPEGYVTLVVSYVGYFTQEINILNPSNQQIKLKPNTEILEEVVVIGYGVQKKTDVIGAISQLKEESLQDIPMMSFEQGIAGQMPGVDIIQTSGSPGATPQIHIRGIGTLTAGIEPLMVIDGLPISENMSSSTLNPNDIASIEVLKDAASASIYGSRGANGVILITTKKGEKGKTRISFNAYTGVQEVTQKIALTDAYQRAKLVAVARNNGWVDANPSLNSPNDPNSARPTSLQIPDFYFPYLEGQKNLVNTDWQDEIFRPAYMQSYELSASGGNDAVNYYASGNYFKQEGIVVHSDYKRYSFRTNLEAKLSNKLRLGLNIAPSFAIRNKISEADHKSNGIVLTALITHPAFPARNTDGTLAVSNQIMAAQKYGFAPTENPLALALLTENKQEQARFFGGVYFNFEPVKGLNLKTYWGADYNSVRESYFRPSTVGAYQQAAPLTPEGTSETARVFNWVNENTLTYDKMLGQYHHLNILAGFTIQKENIEKNYLYATNFPNDEVRTLNTGQVTDGQSYIEEWGLLSYLARLVYDYQDKYLFNVSLRRDGSSRFGINSKWGWFPSTSVGWRISEESFFPQTDILSELKLRLSWGITGNNQIGNYGAVALLNSASYVLNDKKLTGLAPYTAPNRNISWEKNDMTDVGLDIGLFDNKLTLTLDYYYAITKDLLLNVPVPAQSGYNNSLQNIGKVSNQGFEVGINTKLKIKEVELNASINFSTNQNEVLALGPNQEQILGLGHITKVGQPIGSFYGYQILGVFKDQEALDNYPHLSKSKVGSYQYADLDQDGQITDKDRTSLGNFSPKYTFGFSLGIRYKGFDFNALIQGKQGYQILNANRFFLYNQEGWGNASTDLMGNYFDASTPTDAQFARPLNKPTDKLYEFSNLVIEDGSFVRVRNISLGYTLPKSLIHRLLLSKARIYVAANNPFTFTKYSGYNPEVTSQNTSWNRDTITQGIDYGAYPIAKTFMAGINLTF